MAMAMEMAGASLYAQAPGRRLFLLKHLCIEHKHVRSHRLWLVCRWEDGVMSFENEYILVLEMARVHETSAILAVR